jgi:uncharacterized membrane protein YfcA
MLVLGYLLATVVGFSLGALGAGGALLAIPVFVYILHFQDKQAVASAFVIVAIVGLLAAWKHLREGHIHLRLFTLLAPTAMIGAYAGVVMSQKLTPTAHLLMLSFMMVTSALLMLLPQKDIQNDGDTPEGDVSFHIINPPLFALLGLGVGVLVGLIGVGGGFIILPILVSLAHVPMRKAIGTTLLISVMNAAVGAISSLRYTAIPWEIVLPFAAIAVVGGLSGAYLNGRVSIPVLRKAFSTVLILVAGAMLYENVPLITQGGHFLGLALNQDGLR